MKLDKVSILRPATYHEQPARHQYETAKGYDITATPIGVVVVRLPECTVPLAARDEPMTVLVPWVLVGEPCSVAKEQPVKK
jgi:hypothetical protein